MNNTEKPPHISNCDDGSLIAEWMGEDYRLFISIEPNVLESSLGYVDKSGKMVGGCLPKEIIDRIKEGVA